MKIGLSLPNNQGVPQVAELVELARFAESAGAHSVWVSEHLFHASYVARRLGTAPYHEPLTVLTAAAVATQRIRLATSVLVLPWHHPVRLAKTIASLDNLSGGRVTLGFGVAQTADEYANLGIDFASRGGLADEVLLAMKALWTQPLPEFAGEHFAFSGLAFEPKPIQQPHPPLLIGGNSARALRRVREHGDGWHALSRSPADMAAGIAELNAAGAVAPHVSVRLMVTEVDEPWERPVQQRRTLKGTAAELREMLQAYASAGVAEVIVDANSADLVATRRMLDRMLELAA